MQTSNQQIASSVHWSFSQFNAKISNQQGFAEIYPIKSLIEIGIPTSSMQGDEITLKLTSAVNTWKKIDPTEYLNAHGLLQFNTSEFKHQVYSFQANGKKFVVPALALLRALMLPRRFYMEDAFNHSFLDRTVRIKKTNGEIDFELLGDKACHATIKSLAYTKGLFSWFIAYPSATKMVNSIHRLAREGVIGIDLPKADLSFVVHGTQVDDTVFVHSLRLCSITPTERPALHIVNMKMPIAITSAVPPHKCAEIKAIERYTIPLKNDGSLEMSVDEWDFVKREAGFTESYLARFKYLPRVLLNSIFRKIHSGATWRNSSFEPADWRTAATVFQSMHKTGKFKVIIDTLTLLRSRA